VTLGPQATTSEADLIAYCRERLAAYKYPRQIEFRDSLPMIGPGKVLKKQLVQEMASTRTL
jgi:long-chain acyl-CoA synthetase